MNDLAGISWEVTQDMFWSSLAAMGFAMLFNVPTRTLIGCIACGALGHGIRTLSVELGATIVSGSLIGAIVIGLMGYLFARRWHAPAIVFTLSGSIPLVPGRFAYSTMLSLIQLSTADPKTGEGLLVQASINGIKTMMILGVIAAGISAPTLLFERSKPPV
ncbi:MAG: threonine/serine exporter family protein [Chloroflexi bacterium]|nr:threonine/serine exporter family protein [Chloroflexota bacterium]